MPPALDIGPLIEAVVEGEPEERDPDELEPGPDGEVESVEAWPQQQIRLKRRS
jgi:hypothetical protein